MGYVRTNRIMGAIALVLALGSAVHAEKAVIMTIFGDSIPMGNSAGRASANLVGRLALLRPHWFIRNYSVGFGSISGDADNQYPPMDAHSVLRLWGDAVLVMLGTVDWGFAAPLGTFRTKYEACLDTLQASKAKIICVTPTWRSDEVQPNRIGVTLDAYREIIAAECRARSNPVIDGRTLIPHSKRYFVDGLHPNASGYRVMSERLVSALRPFVR